MDIFGRYQSLIPAKQTHGPPRTCLWFSEPEVYTVKKSVETLKAHKQDAEKVQYLWRTQNK